MMIQQTLKLDKWQKDVLATEGKHNIAVRCSRQLGKSTVISILAAKYAVDNKNKSVMIISHTERQAYLLFSKIHMYLADNYKVYIKKGKDRPTKTELKLNNGSIIRCLPTGMDGMGIRGYTVDLLIADEAAMIYEEVWPAVTPMLATTGGKIILLSTPMGASGYFYDRCFDDDFIHFHIDPIDTIEGREEPQRTEMFKHREREKERLTELQFAQEYMGDFIDAFRRVFPDDLLKQACISDKEEINKRATYYMGVDLARLGRDYSSFEIIRKYDNGVCHHVEHILTQKTYTPETHRKILELDRLYNFKEIGIDAGSGTLGVGVLDWLLTEPQVKRKVVALNSRKRMLDFKGERTARLLNQDMYLNMRSMMANGKLRLLNNDEIIAALADISFEYPNDQTTVKIFAKDHRSTDIAEGLIRASWLAKEKRLNMWVSWV